MHSISDAIDLEIGGNWSIPLVYNNEWHIALAQEGDLLLAPGGRQLFIPFEEAIHSLGEQISVITLFVNAQMALGSMWRPLSRQITSIAMMTVLDWLPKVTTSRETRLMPQMMFLPSAALDFRALELQSRSVFETSSSMSIKCVFVPTGDDRSTTNDGSWSA